MVPKFRVYEVVCKDPAVSARYIGYTSMTKSVFLANQLGHLRDPVTGKKSEVDPAPSTLQTYVCAHGGWSNWDFRVFRILHETRYEASFRKELIIARHPDVYSINIYKTGVKRAPRKPKLTEPETDSDYESVYTED